MNKFTKPKKKCCKEIFISLANKTDFSLFILTECCGFHNIQCYYYTTSSCNFLIIRSQIFNFQLIYN